jgi:putative ABC transport system ATP-binding protein
MLQLNGISKIFRTDSIETHALRDISLTINEGEFVAITGPSGSGKTTLLNVLGMLENIDGGNYQLDSVDVSQLGDSAMSKIRNRKIGFVFQSFNLLPDLNVEDNVDLPLRYREFNAGERQQRVRDALTRVGLSARAKHMPSELSGGQQQRVAIARALAGSPRLILADEPNGNLDSLMARQVMELLEAIHDDGVTVVMVTHDPSLARRAQRHIHVLDGEISEVGLRAAPLLANA